MRSPDESPGSCGPEGATVDPDMSWRPLDTAASSWSRYEAVLDGMSGPERIRAAVELSEVVRELRLAGIRAVRPELSPREAVSVMVAEDHGVELPVLP